MEELPDVGENITSEHAVLIPTLPAVKSLMAYVEAVAVVIGSCHIHSVYEDREHVKIYLKHKRFVDILVNNGVTVLGRQMNVDYYMPRADKVVLSNVDPIVPDAILIKLLCFYGTPVTSIIHEKIATNAEYSHILCGRRKVYMSIFSDKKIPTTISFNYQDTFYKIHVLVEECDTNVAQETVETDEHSEEEANDEVLEVESSDLNVKPNIIDIQQETQSSPKQSTFPQKGKGGASAAVGKIKRRARSGWYKNRVRKVQRLNQPRVIGQPGRRVKRLVAKKQQAKGVHTKVSRAVKSKPTRQSTANAVISEAVDDASPEIIEDGAPDGAEKMDISVVSPYPLSMKDLEKFMFKTRFQRDITQVAWEFLSDKTPEALEALKSQMQELFNVTHTQSLKHRIRRIIAALKFSDNPEIVE